MRWLIRILIIAVVVVLVVNFFPNDQGEIFLRMPGGVLPPFKTTPLVFFIALFLALVIVLITFRFSLWFLYLPWSLKEVWGNYNNRKNEEKLLSAWSWYSSGGYIESLKIAEKVAKNQNFQNEAAILAVYSLIKIDKVEEAGTWLAKVTNPNPRLQLLNSICKVELYLRKGEPEQAINAIAEIENNSGFNSVVGRMKIHAYQLLNNWEDVIKVAEVLRKKDLVSLQEYRQWVTTARIGELAKINSDVDSSQANIYKWWRKLGADEKYNEQILDKVINTLIHRGENDLACKVIEKAVEEKIAKNSSDKKELIPNNLFSLYAENYESEKINTAIKTCQKWLESEKDNPALLRATARLCEREMLWGNAISYYEASLAFDIDKSALKALAKIFDETEQADKAVAVRGKLMKLMG